MVDLADKVKSLRNDKRLTQQQLAQRLNITKSMISAYEAGMRMPSLAILTGLARIFGVSCDYLLGLDAHKTLDVSTLTDEQVNILRSLIDQFDISNKK